MEKSNVLTAYNFLTHSDGHWARYWRVIASVLTAYNFLTHSDLISDATATIIVLTAYNFLTHSDWKLATILFLASVLTAYNFLTHSDP